MLSKVELQRQADHRIHLVMQNADINEKINALALALAGFSLYCLEKENGSGHEYGEMLSAAYRYHAANPQAGMDQYLGYALTMIASDKSNPMFADCADRLIRLQLENQKKNAPIMLNEKQLKSLLSGKKQGGGRKTGLIAAVIALVLVLAAVYPVMCLVYRNQAQKALDDGDYVKAAEYFAKDKLFSRSADELVYEKVLSLAQSARNAGKYEEAEEYLAYLGDAAKQEWEAVVFEHAESCMDQGDYRKADELLSQLDSAKARELRDTALEALALQYIEQGDYTAAELAAKKTSDPTALLNSLYHTRAEALLNEGDLTGASELYGQCQEDEAAQADLTVLQDLIDGKVRAVANAAAEGKTDVPMQTWLSALNAAYPDADRGEMNANLDFQYARGVLAGTITQGKPMSEVAEGINALVEGKTYVGRYSVSQWDEDGKRFVIKDLSELMRTQCFGQDGRVLVVNERSDFPGSGKSYAVMMDAMELLPKERYPEFINQVQYILLIRTNHQQSASRTGFTGLQEIVNVTLIQVNNNTRRVYDSAAMLGPKATDPNDSTIRWSSGTCPNITDALQTALSKLK